MAIDGRELDLEIVSTSWRSLSDGDAYESMIAAWDRKIRAVESGQKIPLVDSLLKRQLQSIDHLLDDQRTLKVEDPLELAVGETPAPAVVLSPDGLVVALNEKATSYFGAKLGTRLETDWLRDESIGDYRAVRKSGPGGSNTDYAIVRTITPEGYSALAEVYRLESADAGSKAAAVPSVRTVIRSLELDWYDTVPATLSKVFGLTRAEIEVCRLLFAHRDLALVAQERDVGLETVRSQVKAILGKTELPSKVELIRLLALLCARAAFQQEKRELAWSDPLGNETIFMRSDGRRLAFSWTGAEDGQPVLFLPGQTSFHFFPEAMRAKLAAAGIKLITPSVPGHGNSDTPRAKSQIEDGTEALEEFCEAHFDGPVPAVATRSAQFYLIRLAQLRPDLVSKQICVSLPWNICAGREASLPKGQRTIFRLALDAPLAFEIACRLGYRMLKQRGPDFYRMVAYGDIEADRITLEDPELQPLLRAASRHIVAQGYKAFMREQDMCVKSPLPSWVQQLQVPLHWIVPGATCDLTDEDLAEIHALNPLVSVETVDGAGELLAYQRPDLFIERIGALVRDDHVA